MTGGKQKRKLKGVECIIMACFMFFIAGMTVFTGEMSRGQREDIEDMNLKPQDAVISKVEYNHKDTETEFDQDLEDPSTTYEVYVYDRYVTYTFEGTTYEDIYLDQFSDRRYYETEDDKDMIGSEIAILVDPSYPKNIFRNVNHGKPFEYVMAGVAIGFTVIGAWFGYLGIVRSRYSNRALRKSVRLLFFLPWLMALCFVLCVDTTKIYDRYPPAVRMILHLALFIVVLILYIKMIDHKLPVDSSEESMR